MLRQGCNADNGSSPGDSGDYAHTDSPRRYRLNFTDAPKDIVAFTLFERHINLLYDMLSDEHGSSRDMEEQAVLLDTMRVLNQARRTPFDVRRQSRPPAAPAGAKRSKCATSIDISAGTAGGTGIGTKT